MSSTLKNSSKWNTINLSDNDGKTSLEIKELKYSPSQAYGVTFNEHESTIICRVLDVCEGVLTRYSLRKLGSDNDMFAVLFDPKICDYYWVNGCFIVLVFFNRIDQAIHHFGFEVDHGLRTLLHSDNHKSISSISSDGSRLTNEETYWMPWKAGIAPLFIQGEAYIVISTIEKFIINKFIPGDSFQGRLIENRCTDANDEYLTGAIPFAFGSKMYFVLHQNVAYLAHNGDERRKLYADRLACVDMSDVDLGQGELVISDDMVNFVNLVPTRLGKGQFYTSYDHEIRQQGNYLIIQENKTSTRSKKRPATKKRVFIIDLEKQTVNLQNVNMRE